MVPPAQADRFKDILENADVESVVLNKNIQEAIDNEYVAPAQRATGFNWTAYHTLDEVSVSKNNYCKTSTTFSIFLD